MQNIRKLLIEAYYNNDYKRYIELFDDYILEGYGVDSTMISYYITVLIRIRKFDDAYKLIQEMEKYIGDYDISDDIARLYLYCFKPEDTRRVLFNTYEDIDLNLLVRAYLLEGKIEEAERIVNKCLEINPSDINMLKSKIKIDNHKNKNAFIETEYSCFLANGNQLEKGHIVFLKNNPTTDYKVMEDEKLANRPYMIWKVENDKLFLFPVTTKCKDSFYKLYSQNYPNSIGDRVIKSNFFYTDISNVLTVEDKGLDIAFYNIAGLLVRSIYFGCCKEDKKACSIFLKDCIGDVNMFDVLEVVDPSSRKHSFYYVIDSNYDDHYDVVEINYNNLEVISMKKERFSKARFIYKKHTLEEVKQRKILSQLPKTVTRRSICGSNVIIDGIKYIIVYDRNEHCVCVNAGYTSSYVNPIVIDKSKISEVLDYINTEELCYIRKLVEEEIGYSSDRLLCNEEKRLLKHKKNK